MRRLKKKSVHTAPGKTSGRKAPLALTVSSLAWGGKAVGRHEGKVIFVSKAVPGDHLLVVLDRVKSRYAEGRIEAVLRPGEDRVDPKCKFFSHCGGCQWLPVRYARQLKEKEELVRTILRHHMTGIPVEPIVPSESATAYRHRGNFHVVRSGQEVRIGFYQEQSHHVVNVDHCLLFDGDYNSLYGRLRSALKEEPAARFLEGLTLARSEAGDHYSIHLKMGKEGKQDSWSVLADVAEKAGCAGVLVTPSLEPEEVHARRGAPLVRFGLERDRGTPGELEMTADIRSFTQVQYAMNRRMVQTVIAWLGLGRHERLLDVYSGVGNFALPLALGCSEVLAVESSPFAHADAKENAARNAIYNVKQLPGDAGEWVKNLAAKSEKFDAILLDPPRTGAQGALENLGHLGARRILYVSCNLPSLDRDLSDLRRTGYVPVRLQPWDLFPQTYGVEILCLLEKR